MRRRKKKSIKDILGRDPVHPFPARMAPEIALDALGTDTQPLRVLDPMVGSGTVLAVARSKGHRAIGVDSDPLAVLLSHVWTRTIDPEHANEKAAEVLDRAKRVFTELPVRDAYPRGSDAETQKFVRYWFDPYARRQLTALSKTISRVHHDAIRDVLWCGFSRLIITKQAGASLAMDLSHSRPHKVFTYAPTKPFNKFLSAVETVAANCPHVGGEPVGPPCKVRQGDARSLLIDDNSIDLVLTSPPYLNAIDYLRCSKFSLVWMGYTIEELRQIRGESIGAEASSDDAAEDREVQNIIKELRLRPRLSERQTALLARYVHDMQAAVGEATRVLKRNGRAVYVVGDSTVRGTFISNSKIVQTVAEACGLTCTSKRARALPANRRYLPPPDRRSDDHALHARMRREVVLEFKKAA